MKLVLLFLVFFLCSCGIIKSTEIDNLSVYPKITETIVQMGDSNKIDFLLRTRNYDHNYPNTAFLFQYIPFTVLPRETIEFTKQKILTGFMKDPVKCADRFYGTNINNYKDRVIFDLLLTEERDNSGVLTGNWIYYLSVYQKPNGKNLEILRCTISSRGKILENYEYNW